MDEKLIREKEWNLHAEENQEIEIDLQDLFRNLLKKWWLIFIGCLGGLILAGIYVFVLAKPVYEASSMIYMRGAGNTISSLQDLQIGAELTNDYQVIFESRPILQSVIDELGLDMDYKALKEMIELSNPTDTRILKVALKSHDPEQAAEIVNALVATSMDSVKEIDAKEPYLIEEAVVDWEKVSPSTIKTLLIGFAMGLVLVTGGLVLLYVMNDRLRSVEDVEKYLDLPVLCLVPESNSCNFDKKGKRGKEKSRAAKSASL